MPACPAAATLPAFRMKTSAALAMSTTLASTLAERLVPQDLGGRSPRSASQGASPGTGTA